MKNIFHRTMGQQHPPWYFWAKNFFHGKARKQWIPRLSTMLNPFLILVSRDFAPLPKFALANSYRNPAKSPFWNQKVKNAWPRAAIILGMYLGACNVQMLLTAAGSEGGDLVRFPRKMSCDVCWDSFGSPEFRKAPPFTVFIPQVIAAIKGLKSILKNLCAPPKLKI